MFLAPSRSDLVESLLITTLLGISLGEPDSKTPTALEAPFVLSAAGSSLSPLGVWPLPPFLHRVRGAIPLAFASALATSPSFFAGFGTNQSTP